MAGFKKGDVVKLKSDGPQMTVTHVDDNGSVQCHWFPTYTEKPIWETFPPEALRLLPSSDR